MGNLLAVPHSQPGENIISFVGEGHCISYAPARAAILNTCVLYTLDAYAHHTCSHPHPHISTPSESPGQVTRKPQAPLSMHRAKGGRVDGQGGRRGRHLEEF